MEILDGIRSGKLAEKPSYMASFGRLRPFFRIRISVKQRKIGCAKNRKFAQKILDAKSVTGNCANFRKRFWTQNSLRKKVKICAKKFTAKKEKKDKTP
jgi:hypothetical protein